MKFDKGALLAEGPNGVADLPSALGPRLGGPGVAVRDGAACALAAGLAFFSP